MRNTVCWWKGHDLSTGIGFWCQRCKQEISYDEFVKDTPRDIIRARLKAIGQWWRCNDCGMRFGRHDPNHDHIPF